MRTTEVPSAMDDKDFASPTSASTTPTDSQAGSRAARSRRRASSFARLRPATAQGTDAPTVRARYSATRRPVKPVAPKTVTA
ncbi:MAG: hypothetical protein R3A52_10850 [Polyangiales bacterium]